MRLIDTHAHLNDDAFAEDLAEALSRAADAGVCRIIVPGYDLHSSRTAAAMAREHECVLATVGVHPHDSKCFDSDTAGLLTEMAGEPGVVAIGEIGLDFHYDFSPRPVQIEAFTRQMELARKLGLPVVIHSREADDETLQVVEGFAPNTAGVFHCFSGDEHAAARVLELGFYIGVDGPITYRSAGRLRRVVEMCPMDRLLVETDCPYLTPAPHRGRRNEPAYVGLILEEVARVRGIAVEEAAAATTSNARDLFGPAVECRSGRSSETGAIDER